MHVRVWLSHDGYRDPDDNLSMLVGAAYTRSVAQSNGSVSIAGVVFGDTKDGGQYYMLNPTGSAPAAFGSDSRYGSVDGNRQAAGNYAFFTEYGVKALKDITTNWDIFDLLADDDGGRRAWNFDADSRSELSAAAAELSRDIEDAIDRTADRMVIYSAGGGANVAAEAIGYLRNQGYSWEDIREHFAVVQHGNNWVTNYESEARALTREVTIPISNQNYATYANGLSGPDLKHAVRGVLDGSSFGSRYAEALAVATGEKPFKDLPSGVIFKTTKDASDAGSHAFAVDLYRLLNADRLGDDEMRTGYDWAHLIDENGGGTRLREIYDSFDYRDILGLLGSSDGGSGGSSGSGSSGGDSGSDGSSSGSDGGSSGSDGGSGGGSGTGSGRIQVSIDSSKDDFEAWGGAGGGDLELGLFEGSQNQVGLRFTGVDLDDDAEITEAYFVFTAKSDSSGNADLVIEIEDSLSATRYSGSDQPGWRSYLDTEVSWDDVASWDRGKTYRTPDISELIEDLIGSDGIDAKDALAFRVTGDGTRTAWSYDSGQDAATLVIHYA